MEHETSLKQPLVTAVAMGYGHLRAASAVADVLGVPPQRADAPPLASTAELRMWQRNRVRYERLSRASQIPWVGTVPRWVLHWITDIAPFDPPRDRSAPDFATRYLHRLLHAGLGRTLAQHVSQAQRPLVSTFYVQALAHDMFGSTPAFCVVTDTDIHRIWAPRHPPRRLVYLTPTDRARRRLLSYGVPEEQVHCTGFPLPPELLGGPKLTTARKHLSDRIARLDPDGRFRRRWGLPVEDRSSQRHPPVQLTAVVGGAGAQETQLLELIDGLIPAIATGHLTLHVATGLHQHIASRLNRKTATHQLEGKLQIHTWDNFGVYYREFNQLLRTTDILWTKPSEMVFYGALGIPLLLAPPIGRHEWYNRRWANEHGVAPHLRSPQQISDWLPRWLRDGVLAAAAWQGFHSMPRRGGYRIADVVRESG